MVNIRGLLRSSQEAQSSIGLGSSQKLSIGVQSFSKLIEEDYIYVDKTEHIYKLIKTGGYYFLSRPRRFGKSLLVSTLVQLFSGNRKLFKSLFIDTTDYDWAEHPVIAFSFASMTAETPEILRQEITWTLLEMAKRAGVDISDAPSLSTKLKKLILEISVKNKVAVLVDEYDFAILRHIKNLGAADACREILRDLFSALKDIEVDQHLKFVFITGVTKFSRTSTFSGLNNLHDLTLDPRAAHLLGFTTEEIITTFQPYLERLSLNSGDSQEKIMNELRFWYNGYLFVNPSKDVVKVYNPFSVLSYLLAGSFDNYWFGTGTPTFLMQLIKTQHFPISAIEGSEVNVDETKSYDIDKIKLIPLLWQTGYLTVDSYNPQTKNYKLTFPNEEVRISFYNLFIEHFAQTPAAELSKAIVNTKQALVSANLPLFFETLQVFFAQIPYTLQLSLEKYYQSIFFVVLKMIGAHIIGEDHTNDGRIDATIETDHAVLIVEFKLNESAESALAQIEEKKYYQKYLQSGKNITLVGVQFDMEKRNIANWVSKQL